MTLLHGLRILEGVLLLGALTLAFVGLDSENPWSLHLLATSTVCFLAAFLVALRRDGNARLHSADGGQAVNQTRRPPD